MADDGQVKFLANFDDLLFSEGRKNKPNKNFSIVFFNK